MNEQSLISVIFLLSSLLYHRSPAPYSRMTRWVHHEISQARTQSPRLEHPQRFPPMLGTRDGEMFAPNEFSCISTAVVHQNIFTQFKSQYAPRPFIKYWRQSHHVETRARAVLLTRASGERERERGGIIYLLKCREVNLRLLSLLLFSDGRRGIGWL